MSFPKNKPFRSKRYRRFVEKLPCYVCHRSLFEGTEIIPHHEETGGVGMKGSDLSCIPLCHEHHDFYHAQGKDTFEKYHNVDLWKARAETLALYIQSLKT